MKKGRRLTRIFLIIGILLIGVLIAGAIYLYPAYRFFTQEETIKLDPTLTILRGGGGNSGILVTDSAVVVIDTKMGSSAKKLFDQVKSVAGNRPVIVINTHYHGDHTKGNYLFKGSKIYIGNYERSFLEKEIAPENQPTNLVSDSLCLNLGNEIVCMYDMGQAHTYHDMIIYLKNHNVLFTGDLVFNHVNPVLLEKSGSDPVKWMEVLDKISTKFPDAKIIPGHGLPGNIDIVLSLSGYFRDMKAAAVDGSREDAAVKKYKDWTEMPMMASPSKTIEFIRKSGEAGK